MKHKRKMAKKKKKMEKKKKKKMDKKRRRMKKTRKLKNRSTQKVTLTTNFLPFHIIAFLISLKYTEKISEMTPFNKDISANTSITTTTTAIIIIIIIIMIMSAK